MKLTVIIPVYQSEKTLSRCLESIVAQNIDDIEIILIDDGSTDGSAQICDSFAQKRNDTKVIHQKNGGLSCARNAGLEIAQGDYITFVDSDDTIGPGTFSQLMSIAICHPEYDFIEYPVVIRKSGKSKKLLCCQTESVYTNMRDYWLLAQGYCHTYACNKLFRRHLFEHIRFKEGELFEDYTLMCQLLNICHTIKVAKCGTYVYYQDNSQSLSNSATGKDLSILLRESMKMLNRYSDKTFYSNVLNIQIVVYERTALPPVLPVMPYWGTWKLFLLHLFGMNTFCKFMKTIRKLFHKY